MEGAISHISRVQLMGKSGTNHLLSALIQGSYVFIYLWHLNMSQLTMYFG